MPTINRLHLVRATLPNRHFRVGPFPSLARALPHSLQTSKIRIMETTRVSALPLRR